MIYLPTGVAFCFTAGIQLVIRSLDVFVWVVVWAGSPNISFLWLSEKFYWGVPLLRSSEVEIAPAQSQLSLRDDFLHSENGVYSLYSENGDYSLHSKNGTGIQVNLC